ncbi:MAG: cytochrome P460 family protein [Dehalococcoidales bacterium]
MMIRGVVVVLVLAVAVTVVVAPSCRSAALPAAAGVDLYAHITDEDDYRQWRLWPDKGELYPAQEPHGAFLTTYVNDRAHSAIAGKKGAIPARSIIVKENYDADKNLVALTVMYKVSGYNPDEGDWFWAKYRPDGTIDAEGKVPGCIECHGLVRDNDFIYTSDLTSPGGY